MTDQEIITQLETRWVEREELQEMLGVSDRKARLWIEALNERLKESNKCVLSTATQRGYHIPSPYCDGDIETATLAVAELKNKAISIFERRQAIENFLKYCESVKAAQDTVQLSLF